MEQPEIKVGFVQTKSIMTKSNAPLGGYSVNPYVGCPHACRYCYASFMKRFTGHTEDWGTFMDVKEWPAITNPQKYAGQKVIIGTVTDGYNPLEEKFGKTRLLLEQLKDSGADILICTKSDLVLRDMDLLTEINKRNRLTVSWSVNTLDEDFKNDMDAAVSIERRLAAMKQVYDAGIRTVCFISPVFPGITDIEAIFERVKDQCDLVWLENLNLRGGFKKTIMDYIAEKHPELKLLYDEIYTRHNRTYFEMLEKKAENMAAQNGCRFVDNETPYERVQQGHPTIVDYFYHEEVRGSQNTGVRNKKEERGSGIFSYHD
jgi:radical SAM mobile pair protein B